MIATTTATATTTAVTIEALAAVLEDFRLVKDNEYLARCVFPKNHTNGDANPSLAITLKDGRVVAYCRVCGKDKQDELWNALREKVARGQVAEVHKNNGPKKEFAATMADVARMAAALENDSEVREYVTNRGISLDVARKLKFGAATWTFEKTGTTHALVTPHAVNGELVGVKARTIRKPKEFSQIPGSSIDGLYARGLLDHASPDVLVFEGPEDCALAISRGFNAVSIIAADSKLSDDDLRILEKFERIYLVGDQDIAGKKAMDKLKNRLDRTKTIRVRLPGVKDIGDIWAANPNPAAFKDYLRRAMRQAQTIRERFDIDDLLTECEIRERQEDATPYVVDKVFPMNAITMIFGEEKSGKSLLTTYILKCVANGKKVFGELATAKRPVLYLDRENSQDEIAGMTEHFAEIGPEPIRYRTRETGCPEPADPGLIAFCEKYKPLVVFDSLTKFSKSANKEQLSGWNPGEMSELFDKLLDLCAAGATVVIIHHATKADAEKYANSHQIGAGVSRAYLIKSEDRPRLHRVRMEGKLSRGAEPTSFNLIAFPTIADRGCFGLADPASMKSDVDMVCEWIATRHPEGCTRIAVRKDMKGMRTSRKGAAIDAALKDGKLTERDGVLHVPIVGNTHSKNSTFPSAGNAREQDFDFDDKSFTVN